VRALRHVIFLFDIDGTLVATDGAGRRAFERALLEVLGLAAGLRAVQLDGKTDPLILDEACAAAGRPAPTADERAAVLTAYLAHLPAEMARCRYQILPGVERALDHLEARGVAIGLQTGNVEGGARCKLERGDLWRRFRFGGYGSDAHERAELVRIAITRGRHHLATDEVWVIGDTPRDVAAAHAAGARAIGVATGAYDFDALERAGADVVLETLEAWPKKL
jgi:phosphoglycolate phosphatase-like HAD superfamily hydrolase